VEENGKKLTTVAGCSPRLNTLMLGNEKSVPENPRVLEGRVMPGEMVKLDSRSKGSCPLEMEPLLAVSRPVLPVKRVCLAPVMVIVPEVNWPPVMATVLPVKVMVSLLPVVIELVPATVIFSPEMVTSSKGLVPPTTPLNVISIRLPGFNGFTVSDEALPVSLLMVPLKMTFPALLRVVLELKIRGAP